MLPPDRNHARRARALRTALLLSAGATLALPVRAHVVAPTALTLRPGTYDYFTVTDQGTCAATITVSTNRPDLIDLCLDSGSGPICGCGTNSKTSTTISETFFVCAAATDPSGNPWVSTQTAAVTVCWVGVGTDINGNPCTEDNCSSLPVNIFITVTPDPQTVGQQVQSGRTPDPINTRTGELYFTEPPDLVVRGPLPLVFQRFYASNLAADGNASSDLGPNWLHNFSWSLAQVGNNVEVVTPRGRVLVFEKPPLSGFNGYALLAPQDQPYELLGGAAEYRLGEGASSLVYVFDLAGRLARIEDQNGNALTLSYAGGKLAQVSDGLGRALAFSYLGNGLLDTVTDGSRTVTFGYGFTLESVLDAAGEATTYAYDPSQPLAGLLVARTDATGRTQNLQAYDGSGRVTTQTNAYGGALSLVYPGPTGGDTTMTDALGNPSVHTHGNDGELTDVTDESGASYGYTYDALGRRTSWTDRLGAKTSWTYDATSEQVASFTAANGAKTTFAYASRSLNGLTFHDLVSVTAPGGATQAFTRDAAGNVTAYTDAAGGTWSFTYSGTGRLLTAVNPLGGVHAFGYAADGDLQTWTDPSGDVTTYAYDSLHRRTSVTRQDGSTSSVTYDALDRPLTLTDGNGATTSFTCDEAGRLVQRVDAEGNPVAWSYDAMGWLQARTDGTDGGGATWGLSRDGIGRVLSTIDPDGLSHLFDYDAVGNLTGLTRPSGGTWSIDPDAESVTAGLTDPLGNTTSAVTNSMGWPTRVTSPEGRVQRRAYDALGRTTRLTAPDGAAVDVDYTPTGRIEGTYGPLGAMTTTYQRNGLGQVTVATDANGQDSTSTFDSEGLRTEFADPLGRTTTFAHDVNERVSQMTFPDLSTVDVLRDGAGRLLSATYSTGEIRLATYKDTGHLETAKDVSLGYDSRWNVVDSNGIGIGRDGAGRVTSLDFGSGMTVSYDWGGDDRVDLLTDWLGATTTFEWFEDGAIETVTFPSGVTITFEYDDDGRLVRIDFGPLGSIDLQLDQRGLVRQADRNLSFVATPMLGSTPCAYDAVSQLLSAIYDLRGRTLSSGAYTYAWGPKYVRSFSDGLWTADFEHDAFGNLTRRTVGGVVQDFTWIYGLGRPVLGVVAENGVPATAVVPFVDGTPLYTIDLSLDARSFLHYDEAGSVVLRSDDAGTVTDAYAYDFFGGMLGETGTTLDDLFTFRATYGWLREEATAGGVAHYHHGDGGGFYRADQGRDLAPSLDIDDPLTFRTSPYVPRWQFSGESALSAASRRSLEALDDESDYGGNSDFLTAGAFLYRPREELNGLGYFEMINGFDTEKHLGTPYLQDDWQIRPNVALEIPDRAVPVSNRSTARESAGGAPAGLVIGGRYMGSAGVLFSDDTVGDFDVELEDGSFALDPDDPLWRTGVADNGLEYGVRVKLAEDTSAGEDEVRLIVGGSWGALVFDARPDSISPPPGPKNGVTYFSPTFAGFQFSEAYRGGNEGIVDEIDLVRSLSRGMRRSFP